jgi:hypothetical protein
VVRTLPAGRYIVGLRLEGKTRPISEPLGQPVTIQGGQTSALEVKFDAW